MLKLKNLKKVISLTEFKNQKQNGMIKIHKVISYMIKMECYLGTR